MNILAIDTESGGVEPENSLLTVYFKLVTTNKKLLTSEFPDVDKNSPFKVLSVLDLKLKPDDGNYNVTAQGMGVNGINLAAHDKAAITYKNSKGTIYDWLQRNSHDYGYITPMGQGVRRDINLITSYTISDKSWDSFVDRRVIDTVDIGKFAQLIGLIPENVSLSLSVLCEYLGINVDEKLLHTAEYDVELNLNLLEWYYEMLKIK
jgi:hypothetical protein